MMTAKTHQQQHNQYEIAWNFFFRYLQMLLLP